MATVAMVLAIITLLPLLRITHWLVRVWDFPRVQIVVLAAINALAGAALYRTGSISLPLAIVVSTLCLAWHLSWIWAYTRVHSPEVPDAPGDLGARHLRLMTANVLMTNRHVSEFVTLVRSQNPDILVTLETDLRWQRELGALHDQFPHRLDCPLDNLYGMHVFSRLPLVDPRIQYLVEEQIPSMHLEVKPWADRDGICLHFVHPAPPSPSENEESTERDAELLVVAKAVRDDPRPLIVAGDLNDVAWSKTTRLFRKISRLLDPRIGRGMYNTFHARWPMMRFPLDHVFLSSHFSLVSMARAAVPGSDHFAIIIEVALGRRAQVHHSIEKPDREDWTEAKERITMADANTASVHQPSAANQGVTP
ncbi:MAG: endonuclease/exonuclease/phosphatase family protein [Burkholderiaceae bacterium]